MRRGFSNHGHPINLNGHWALRLFLTIIPEGKLQLISRNRVSMKLSEYAHRDATEMAALVTRGDVHPSELAELALCAIQSSTRNSTPYWKPGQNGLKVSSQTVTRFSRVSPCC